MDARPAPTMLEKYGLAPSKERGQNFLSDPNVARKIVQAVGPGPDDVVVEIGPGFGAITFGLAELAGHVVAVEVDSGIARAFALEYGEPDGITLVNADVLDFDLAGASEQHGGARLIVAGNLPYGVTSPILGLLIENRTVIARSVLMVQDEVGARIAAAPGSTDYSALSAVVQYHASVRSRFGVRRTCFYPRPKVDARVVELSFDAALRCRSAADQVDSVLYSAVVHAAFGQRRKMLRQSLKQLVQNAGSDAARLKAASGVDMTRRGETLSVDEFVALTRALESPNVE